MLNETGTSDEKGSPINLSPSMASPSVINETRSLTINPSKKSLATSKVASLAASQVSFTKGIGEKIMNNPVVSARLSSGITMRDARGEVLKVAEP